MQKAVSESSTVNLIPVGAGGDKFVDIEDVLPHSQVAKKNVDSKTETIKGIKIEEPVQVAEKSQVKTEENQSKVEKKDDGAIVDSGNAEENKSKEKVKEELELKERNIETTKEVATKEKTVDKSDDSKNIETVKEELKEQKSEESSTQSDDKDADKNKVDAENQPSVEADDDNEPEGSSSEVKAEIEVDQSKLEVSTDPSPKANVSGTDPSTLEESGLPSSSTSRKYFKFMNITKIGITK